MIEKPPPIMGAGRVVLYAVLDDSVTYSGHSSLFVGGTELGPVPCLAITEELKSGEISLLHCDQDWDVLGLGGNYQSIEQAKAKAERIYRGVTAHWIETGVSAEEAGRLWDETWADQHCSFCDKIPPDVDMMIEGKGARICDACVAEFHKMVEEQRQSKS
jgi:hypothetical protein